MFDITVTMIIIAYIFNRYFLIFRRQAAQVRRSGRG